MWAWRLHQINSKKEWMECETESWQKKENKKKTISEMCNLKWTKCDTQVLFRVIAIECGVAWS